MFRRTFWFGTGVVAGVWATTKVNRKLRQLTPESLAAAAADKAIETGHRLKDRAVGFALDVRANMAQREAELQEALGLNAPVDPDDRALPAAGRPAIENRNHPSYVEPPTYLPYPYNRNEDH